jgi:hypothetical protein
MKANALRILCFSLCFAAVQGSSAQMAPPPPQGSAPGGGQRPGVPGAPQQRDGARPPRADQHRGPDAGRPQNNASPDRGGQPRNALQLGPAGRWWDDKSVVANVGISHDQQKKMDSIFNANRPAIVNSYKAFLKAQEHLQSVNKAAHPDQAEVFSAIDAVNQARGDLQKAASAMLLQIRGEMTPEQIEKLENLQ